MDKRGGQSRHVVHVASLVADMPLSALIESATHVKGTAAWELESDMVPSHTRAIRIIPRDDAAVDALQAAATTAIRRVQDVHMRSKENNPTSVTPPAEIAISAAPVVPAFVASAIARYDLYAGGYRNRGALDYVGWLFSSPRRLPSTQVERAAAPIGNADGKISTCDFDRHDIGELADLHAAPLGAPHRVAVFGGTFSPPTEAHLSIACDVASSGRVDEVWLVPCGKRSDKIPVLDAPAIVAGGSPSALQALTPCPGDRYVMTLIAVEARVPLGSRRSRVVVSPFEVWEDGGALASYTLMSRLQALHSGTERMPSSVRGRESLPACNTEFSLVVGEDLLQSIPQWRHADALLDEVKFLVVPRLLGASDLPHASGSSRDGRLRARRMEWLEREDGTPVYLTAVSSTLARHRLRERTGFSEAISSLLAASADVSLCGVLAPPIVAFIRRQRLYILQS